MRVKRFVCNMLQENCYVVSDDETQECVIIDCGAWYDSEREAIVRYIRENKLTPTHLLATHGHCDHNFGNNTVFDTFGLQPEVSERDKYMVNNLTEQALNIFGMELGYDSPAAGGTFEDGDSIQIGRHTLTVIETPGHSRGSVCFYSKDNSLLFTGDTLFKGSIGRTDLEGGNMLQIIQSLRQIAQLPDDTQVYSGHGEPTTIGYELAHNLYMER